MMLMGVVGAVDGVSWPGVLLSGVTARGEMVSGVTLPGTGDVTCLGLETGDVTCLGLHTGDVTCLGLQTGDGLITPGGVRPGLVGSLDCSPNVENSLASRSAAKDSSNIRMSSSGVARGSVKIIKGSD